MREAFLVSFPPDTSLLANPGNSYEALCFCALQTITFRLLIVLSYVFLA